MYVCVVIFFSFYLNFFFVIGCELGAVVSLFFAKDNRQSQANRTNAKILILWHERISFFTLLRIKYRMYHFSQKEIRRNNNNSSSSSIDSALTTNGLVCAQKHKHTKYIHNKYIRSCEIAASYGLHSIIMNDCGPILCLFTVWMVCFFFALSQYFSNFHLLLVSTFSN